MGTRSITQFVGHYVEEDTGKGVEELVGRIYRQFDGYPTGHGAELQALIPPNAQIVNGFTLDQRHPTHFNGAGDLAAFVVKALKDDIGGIYLTGNDPKAEVRKTGSTWIDYLYTLYASIPIGPLGPPFPLHLKIEKPPPHGKKYGKWRVLYEGPLAEADMEKIEENQ